MSKIKAIIFDLDDTLYDTTAQRIDKALKAAVEAMVKSGLNCSVEDGFRAIKEIIKKNPLGERFLKLAEQHNADEAVCEIGKKAYYGFESDELSLFPGVRELLKKLKNDYTLILVTFGEPKTQNKKVELLGIKELFDISLITQNPDKEEVFLEALDKIGIKQNRILCVGDRIDSEIRIANKLGMTTVRIMHGMYQNLKAKSALENPDFTIKNLKEIENILKNIEINESKLEKGPSITLIGGGTGIPTLIEGLKKYTYNIASIITITDEGRSSGMLRKELKILPPGDVRNNIIALSDSEKLLHDLLQYRFDTGSLNGHTVGNVLLAALTKITGNFQEGIKELSKILNLKGGVFPSTLEDTHICAKLEDSTVLKNEQEIVIKGKRIQTVKRNPIKEVFIEPEDVKGNPSAVENIKDADIIVIGPGSLITSVMPNLLIKDIKKAIKDSKAKKVYVCNIVTQPGQTEDFTAADHLRFIEKYLGKGVVDYIVLNNEMPSKKLIEQYEKDKSYIVKNDIEEIKKMGVVPIEGELIEDIDGKKILWEKTYLLRHDSNKVAELIVSVYNNGRK
jgi:uncharacterized cofD-like protein